MRAASRIVGVLLALAGLGFLIASLFVLITYRPESVLEGPQMGKRLTGGLPGLFLGGAFILGGWYFLRLDVDKAVGLRDPSRVTAFFIAHRREMAIIAQTGLMISLTCTMVAFLGVRRPARWTSWVLSPVTIGVRHRNESS